MITIDVIVNSQGWPDQRYLEELAKQIVKTTTFHLDMQDVVSELSLVFTDDAEICRLNNRWRHKNKATNVLSFPICSVKAGEKPGSMLGDIVFAREILEQEALEQKKPTINHLSHLVVHGLLHLFGYDHKHNSDAEIMESLECEIIHILAIPNRSISRRLRA